ncbi:MAG: type II toxin-antitoxin system HicB family antitoxin [Dehalococcoidia bacterium]|nr:type II toxin-antitoxin system HicB family antitoxin [Dehalococcoidia bacterium]
MLVKIETYFDGEFWCARGTGNDIFTQGNSLDELYENIKETVACHYEDLDEPIWAAPLSGQDRGDIKIGFRCPSGL